MGSHTSRGVFSLRGLLQLLLSVHLERPDNASGFSVVWCQQSQHFFFMDSSLLYEK